MVSTELLNLAKHINLVRIIFKTYSKIDRIKILKVKKKEFK